jgi:hypothetical protein
MSVMTTPEPTTAEAIAEDAKVGKIIGKGLYLEFTYPESTAITQILFTPEGRNAEGKYVQFAMMSRTISETSPRKQWRVNFCGTNNEATLGDLSTITNPEELVDTMTIRFAKAVERMVSANPAMKLRSKPISLEITSIDLNEVADYKAPSPALRRLQKARVALDFPEKLV